MNPIPTARGLRFFAAVLAFALASGALAQTATPTVQKTLPEGKKIVEDTIEAMGGKEAIEKLESSKMMAEMSVGPNPAMAVMTTYWAKPDLFMMKQSVQGMVIILGYDGKIGWTSNPMSGGYELLEDEQIEQVRGQANMHGNITRMAEDFQELETVDLVDFEGQKCYKVRMVPKTDDESEEAQEEAPAPEQFSLFNAKTKLLDAMQMSQETPMGAMTVTIKFKDWKKINDVMFYHRMIVEQTGQPPMEMRYTQIEFNKVDPSVFEAPEAVKELAKEREEAKKQEEGEKPDAPGTDG